MVLAQRRAEELTWQLSIATQPNRDSKGQREAYSRAAAVGRVGIVRAAATELVDDRTRVEMIGSCLHRHGSAWADTHAGELRWLASRGISQADAIQRSQKAVAEVLKDSFWE